jgi:hypothetical protein
MGELRRLIGEDFLLPMHGGRKEKVSCPGESSLHASKLSTRTKKQRDIIIFFSLYS